MFKIETYVDGGSGGTGFEGRDVNSGKILPGIVRHAKEMCY